MAASAMQRASGYAAPIPLPGLPMVDQTTGIITEVWFEWFVTLLRRTGGADGTASAALQALLASSGTPVVVTLGASPFIYTAPALGSLLVSGAGVIRLEITTDGATWYPTGAWHGAFPLSKGCQARLTYIGAPSLVFIPISFKTAAIQAAPAIGTVGPGGTGSGGTGGTGGTGSGGTGGSSGSAASRVNDFLKIIGINGQIQSYGAGAPYTNASGIVADAQYIGARLWRDGTNAATAGAQLTAITALAAAGIQFSILPTNDGSTPTYTTAGLIAQLHTIAGSYSPNPIIGIEQPNEPSGFGFVYGGVTGGGGGSFTAVAAFMQDYYAALKADGTLAAIPVWSATETGEENPNVGIQFPTVPPGGAGTTAAGGTQYFDVYNIHIYPEYNGAVGYIDPNPAVFQGLHDQYQLQLGQDFVLTNGQGYAGLAATAVNAAPRVVSEMGFGVGRATAGSGTMTDAVRGKNLINAYLIAYLEGFAACFAYELYNESDGYGWFTTTATPLLPATYMHTMVTVLADTAANAAGFTPAPLSYSISGLPATAQTLLLQKAGGQHVIAIWNNTTNLNASGPVTIAPVTLTVTVAAAANLAVYDVTAGTTPISTSPAALSTSLTLTDHALFVTVDSVSAASGVSFPLVGFAATNGNENTLATDAAEPANVPAGITAYNYYNNSSWPIWAEFDTLSAPPYGCLQVAPWPTDGAGNINWGAGTGFNPTEFISGTDALAAYQALAQNCAAAGTSLVSVQIGWEWNSGGGNDKGWDAPGLQARYIQWFQTVAGYFRTYAPNVIICWAMNSVTMNTGGVPEDFYPGDAFVDAVAMDAYSFNCQNGGPGNVSFSGDRTNSYGWMQAFSAATNRGPGHPGASFAAPIGGGTISVTTGGRKYVCVPEFQATTDADATFVQDVFTWAAGLGGRALVLNYWNSLGDVPANSIILGGSNDTAAGGITGHASGNQWVAANLNQTYPGGIITKLS